MDLTKVYNVNGIFVPELYFVEQYQMFPHTFGITFNDEAECDLDKLSEETLKSAFPNMINYKSTIAKYTVVEGHQEKDPSMPFAMDTVCDSTEIRLSEGGSAVVVFEDHRIYKIDTNSIYCRSLEDKDTIEKACFEAWKNLPKRAERPKEAIVNLVGYSDGDYYTIESKIKKVNISIEENYNDDFLPVHKDITDFLATRESGLILLHGLMGSGKSSYIRHLINKYPTDYIIVPTSLTSRLADPDFITFMVHNSNSVFILEDCEQLLMDRSVNIFNGGISNILNMSDGLLSDIMNLKFICTFNADIKTIDQALLRKGRCYAKYEFKELCEEKVKALNDKYNLGIKEIKPMTLAEIYNADRTEYADKPKQKKIGF